MKLFNSTLCNWTLALATVIASATLSHAGANVTVGRSSLSKTLAACDEVMERANATGHNPLEGYLRCPTAAKFAFRKFSIASVRDYFERQSAYSLREVSAEEGALVISEGMINAVNAARENLTAGKEAHEEKILNKMANATALINGVLERAGSNAIILIDDDTHSAPSVGARVLILVNPDKKSATEIIHSDLEG